MCVTIMCCHALWIKSNFTHRTLYVMIQGIVHELVRESVARMVVIVE